MDYDFEVHPVGTKQRIERLEKDVEIWRQMYLAENLKRVEVLRHTQGTEATDETR